MGNVYCPEDLPNHEQVICDDYFPGGLSEFIVFNSSAATTDPTNATEINTDLASGNATLVKGIFAELTEPGDKVINNPRTNQEIVQGFEFGLSYTDWNVTADNVNFYDELNFFTGAKLLMYEPLLDNVGRAKWVSDTSGGITFKAKQITPVADSEFQSWSVVATWVNKLHPEIVDLPAGIFNQ